MKRLRRFLLTAASLLAALLVTEGTLHLVAPDLAPPSLQAEPIFIEKQGIGYELRPFARIELEDEQGKPVWERLNSDGFRGREYAIPKPEKMLRILTVGNSVVQGGTPYLSTWQQGLKRKLKSFFRSGHYTEVEVINAGVGGYFSWQTLLRLRDRGLKYQPDWVLVMVGWNNMLASSLDSWKPRMSFFEAAKRAARTALPERLYTTQLIRQLLLRTRFFVRNRFSTGPPTHPSRIPFNEEALLRYERDLERMYRSAAKKGSRMGLITAPIVLTPDLLEDEEIHRKMASLYLHFPLIGPDLLAWYDRYLEAQRSFAVSHPDVLLVDAARIFSSVGKEERLRMFDDFIHLTPYGNEVLAKVIFQVLRESGRIGQPET